MTTTKTIKLTDMFTGDELEYANPREMYDTLRWACSDEDLHMLWKFACLAQRAWDGQLTVKSVNDAYSAKVGFELAITR